MKEHVPMGQVNTGRLMYPWLKEGSEQRDPKLPGLALEPDSAPC
jgi:hypothetical protein